MQKELEHVEIQAKFYYQRRENCAKLSYSRSRENAPLRGEYVSVYIIIPL